MSHLKNVIARWTVVLALIIFGFHGFLHPFLSAFHVSLMPNIYFNVIIILEVKPKMELSPEKDHFVKLSYILFDVVPRYLRDYFIRLWDQKYPNEKWHDDVGRKTRKLQRLLVTKDGRQKQDAHSLKILNGDEEEWDITTLMHAILDSGLKLIKGCRPPDQRTIPLRESEELEIIRGIWNSEYAHLPDMSCTLDEFIDIMIKVNRAANNLFGIDAEREIYRILLSSTTIPMREQVEKLLDSKLFYFICS